MTLNKTFRLHAWLWVEGFRRGGEAGWAARWRCITGLQRTLPGRFNEAGNENVSSTTLAVCHLQDSHADKQIGQERSFTRRLRFVCLVCCKDSWHPVILFNSAPSVRISILVEFVWLCEAQWAQHSYGCFSLSRANDNEKTIRCRTECNMNNSECFPVVSVTLSSDLFMTKQRTNCVCSG